MRNGWSPGGKRTVPTHGGLVSNGTASTDYPLGLWVFHKRPAARGVPSLIGQPLEPLLQRPVSSPRLMSLGHTTTLSSGERAPGNPSPDTQLGKPLTDHAATGTPPCKVLTRGSCLDTIGVSLWRQQWPLQSEHPVCVFWSGRIHNRQEHGPGSLV